MSSLVDSLIQQLQGSGAADQIAGKLGVPADQANSAVTAAVPAILAGLARNTQQPEGAAALADALERDHDGSVLDDNSYFDSYDQHKGDRILGHVFGDQAPAVQSQVSALGGLNPAQGGEVMKMLAPLVMGFLGKQKAAGNLDVSGLSQLLAGGTGGLQLPGGLGDLLGRLTGGTAPSSSDASSSDTQRSSSGLGAILGRIFGRK